MHFKKYSANCQPFCSSFILSTDDHQIHKGSYSLQWRHNGRDSVSDHQPRHCFIQRFIQAQIKESIKAPRHWPLCGEFTGDQWIPRTNAQKRGKCFHLMIFCSNAENVSTWWCHHVANRPKSVIINVLLDDLKLAINWPKTTVWLVHRAPATNACIPGATLCNPVQIALYTYCMRYSRLAQLT